MPAPLFERARAEGLWFLARYHQIWFSPDELAAEQASGKFCWGAANWELRDPSERVLELGQAAKAARDEFDRFIVRLAGERT